MTRPRPDAAPRPRIRLTIWLAGVLLAASAGLTAWALTSRAEAPPDGSAAAPLARTDQRFNFLGYADLEAGVTPLYPLQQGRVATVVAHDGDAVEAGAPLFTLDAEAAADDVAAAEVAVRDAQLQVEQAQKLAAQHQAQVDAQQKAVDARKAEAEAAHAKADEVQRLYKLKQVSDETAHAADAQAKAGDEAAGIEQAKLRLVQLDDPSIAVKRAQNDVDAKQAQLRKAQLAVRECTVKAPAKGMVERMLVSVGQTLGPNPQQPAAMFAADGPRVIRAEVEQEWADHVAVGRAAVVQDYSASGPTWHGKVTRLSDWYTHRRSILLEPMQFNDVRTLEAIVTLDPGQPPLRIGQRVRVTMDGGS